ncbi:DNA cytosine methyltransferase [Candidatus Saccharibacteria bacterium]|nr:DNA cytosine methyltransferase [Candidatus Saccharibacteria bacterium]
MKHLELFAGIGGFRRGFELLEKDYQDIQTKCIGFSEIDPWAKKTYNANYSTDSIDIGDIVEFASDKNNIISLPDFDILTGGFPCQSFSMMGKKHGFKDVRGNVFFQILEILKYKEPKFVLLENVRNLKTHDKGHTFEIILESLHNLGYNNIFFDIFNTGSFGLAQTRNRIYIFASKKPLPPNFCFNSKVVYDSFAPILNSTSLLKQKTTLDILEKEVEQKYYLSDALKTTILSDGTKKFKSKSEINLLTARPLTATMVKMHRACQDNYFSKDFIANPKEYMAKPHTKEEIAKEEIRKITPKEALALQGFDEEFFARAQKAGVSNHQLYKQAGNAASVNTVYAILYYIFVINKIME